MTYNDLEPHARVSFELAKAESRDEVLGLALSAASTCWEDVAAAGVFDSTEASLIIKDTSTRLAELDKPNLGLATTAELMTELMARYQHFQLELNEAFATFLAYRTVDKS